MYTHPDFARVELLATLAGRPLYASAGYKPIEHIELPSEGVPVPVIRMGKTLK
jgi:hypothetical protein